MRSYKNWILAVCLIGFIGLGVSNVTKTHNKLQFKDIQLKSTTTDLLNLQLKYDLLNRDLQQQLNSKTQDQGKIQDLQKQIQDLGNQRDQLQQQLQTRADEKAAAEQKIAQAASLAARTYAAGDPKGYIYNNESGNNPGSINASSGACGLGQALPCSKMPCSLSDYACQDNYFTTYMLERYGSWSAAAAFWSVNRWWWVV